MKVNTHKVASNGVSLHATSYGEPQHTPVVLVHGYPDSSQVWQPVEELLADQYYVIAYDVRGAGQSDAPESTADYKLDLLSQDLLAVADTLLPGRKFHLVGHDWGSIQSWESVTTERLRGRIASFTSISGPALDHVSHWMRKRTLNLSPAAKAKVLGQLASSWYILMFQLPWLAPALWDAGLGKVWPKMLEKREGVIDAAINPTQTADGRNGVGLYRANFIDKLLHPEERFAHCPVQLIIPTKDAYVGAQLFEDLHEWVPELYRRELGAGHWVPLSHPTLLARWIGEFVQAMETREPGNALAHARVQSQRNKLPLKGKLALVTGAGSGIGRATALKLADVGADVIVVDIRPEAAERTAGLCRMLDALAWPKSVDVGNTEAMEELARWVEKEFGCVDIVVNNAGIGMAGGILDTTVADWEKVLKVNLWGVIHGSRLFAKQMVDHGRHGHIVNVASAAAFMPSKRIPAYATSKAAVQMLTECLRAELADKQIGVSAICPGLVGTGIARTTAYAGLSPEEHARKRAHDKQQLKNRQYSPEAVASVVLRAIRYNEPIALAGAEAWTTRLVSRFAPSISRFIARFDMAT